MDYEKYFCSDGENMLGSASAAVFLLLKSAQKRAPIAHVFSNTLLEKSQSYLDVKICCKY